MQVLAIVTLPISRYLRRWPKEEPSTFEVSDWCHEPELVERSCHKS